MEINKEELKKLKELEKLAYLEEDTASFVYDEFKKVYGKIRKVKQDLEEIELTPGENGKDGIDGRDGIDGKDGKDGINGLDGKDGYTPIKGKDYFTQNEIENIIRQATPVKGVDYFDGEDGKDGKDGENGNMPKHEWEGTKLRFEMSNGKWGEWVDLRGKDANSYSIIGGGSGSRLRIKSNGVLVSDTPATTLNFNPQFTVGDVGNGEFIIGTTIKSFLSLNDTPDSYSGQAGKSVSVKSDESGLEFTSNISADEKVKYDASDPTAGYLADKIVAGNGISIAEGTGADENKVKITNDDKGSAAVSTHEQIYDHDLIATALQSETDPVFSQWLINTPPLYSGDNISELANDSGYLTAIDHNDTDSIQGGVINEYYHLTAAEYNSFVGKQEKRHDWVSPNDYCGLAPIGSAESDSVWTITRIVVANDGSTTTSTQTNVKWTDRLTIF